MSALVPILISIGTKFLTERFLIRVFVEVAEYLAKKSSNTLDDKLIKSVKDALGYTK